MESITAERDQLAQEKAELQDRLVRRQAEFENFRRRVARERTELVEFAGMESVGALLPMLDDFERALKVECADKEYAARNGPDLPAAVRSARETRVGADRGRGQSFDPNLHHAVELVQTCEADDQTVIEELQRGYNFRGRLLRPAMVKVAVRPKDGESVSKRDYYEILGVGARPANRS